MTEPSARKLAVFLTNGQGLGDWQAVGSLSREVAIYERLVEADWSVTFYSYDRTRHLPSVGFPAQTKPQWPYLLPRWLDPIYWVSLPLLRFPAPADRPSIILTNQAHSGWPAIVAGKLWGARLVARCGYVYGEREAAADRRGFRVRRRSLEEKLAFRVADRCVVPTAELAEWVAENYAVAEAKIAVIPNYVDTDVFRPLPAKPGVDVISVGRLVEKKRHHLLLEALAGTDLRVRIIGSGGWEGRLRRLAEERGVALDLVTRVENERLPEMLNGARLYVNLSRWEGHPKALIEAMACGRACIGAESPGIENLLDHGRTGWVVRPEASEVRSAIATLLDDDRKRVELGAAARAHAVATFSLAEIFRRYTGLFDDLLSERRSPA
jgi:glycosyltransferase involved in cell wall biosynthesis